MKTFWIRTGTFLFVVASFATPALAQDNSARLLTAVPVDSREGVQTVVTPRQLRGFSVVLVEGDLRGANATEGLPAAATKALADVKDFLPYKGYRLLDTQWTLGHGKQAIRLRASVDQELRSRAGILVSLLRVRWPESGTIVENHSNSQSGDYTISIARRDCLGCGDPKRGPRPARHLRRHRPRLTDRDDVPHGRRRDGRCRDLAAPGR